MENFRILIAYAHEIRIEDKFECYPSFARKRKIKSEENLFLVID